MLTDPGVIPRGDLPPPEKPKKQQTDLAENIPIVSQQEGGTEREKQENDEEKGIPLENKNQGKVRFLRFLLRTFAVQPIENTSTAQADSKKEGEISINFENKELLDLRFYKYKPQKSHYYSSRYF